MDKVRHSFLLELNKFRVYTYALTTLIFYVFLTIKLFMEIKQLKVSFGHFAALICHFWVWDWVLKQLQVLLMYIYKFPFLCFAHNQFLHGVLANVENFYRRTNWPTDGRTQWDIEAPCRSLKKGLDLVWILISLVWYLNWRHWELIYPSKKHVSWSVQCPPFWIWGVHFTRAYIK